MYKDSLIYKAGLWKTFSILLACFVISTVAMLLGIYLGVKVSQGYILSTNLLGYYGWGGS